MLKGLDRWLTSWLFRRRSTAPKERHLLIAICDHFEPFHDADRATALARVARWRREHTAMTSAFVDSGGIPPRHTFFYPIEQWDPEVCSNIADLCHATGGEGEIHLHHADDTAEILRAMLLEGRSRMAALGLLARDQSGAPRYGFIHGNWALDNSHPQGKFCGVSNELDILRETGCYADFTLPSAPSPCQVRTINSLYYACEDGKPRSHEQGTHSRVGVEPAALAPSLLLVQGPLALNWRRRKLGILPRIENADLTGANPPTRLRLALWERCHIHVHGQPGWIFIKLHTHGGIERNSNMLLGEPMRDFHRSLAQQAQSDPGFHYHYVSAREMVNLIHAAEAGANGDPTPWRDHVYKAGATA